MSLSAEFSCVGVEFRFNVHGMGSYAQILEHVKKMTQNNV